MSEIKDTIGEAAAFDQLAEECVELAKECMKMSRIIRGKNPTPKTRKEVAKNIAEEWADVNVSAVELGLERNGFLENRKRARWIRRLQGANLMPFRCPVCGINIEQGDWGFSEEEREPTCLNCKAFLDLPEGW